jgi:hypothetical protein
MQNLQRLLRRLRMVVEEAETWKITNQATVHQLNILRKEMYVHQRLCHHGQHKKQSL